MANVIKSHSVSSTPPSYDMATMTLARVEEEIASYKRTLCDLYFRKNSFTPIFRLPTETLQAIFIQLAREYYDKDQACSTVPNWVNVSYVCRRWRGVALNCSTLWSYLFILSPRWTDELLARSKQASLHVNVDLYRDAWSLASRFLKQVAMHTDRIQDLRLVFGGHDRLVIHSFLLSRVPRLKNLTIVATNVVHQGWPSVLFVGDTPLLRTLTVRRYPFSWNSLRVTGLTTLRLRDVPHQFKQNTVDLLVMLGCIRHLTYIELDDALSSAVDFLSSAAFQAFQKIELPHLSRFLINAPISTVIALLHCLSVPLKTVVRLECTSESGLSLDDYAPLSLLLAQRFDPFGPQAASSPIVRSLCIKFGCQSVTLTFDVLERGGGTTASQVDDMWGHNTPLKISIYFNRDHSEASFVGDMCCSMPLTGVQSLYVSRVLSSSGFWRKTLGALQGIRYLKLEEGRMPDLVPLLSVGDGEDQGGPPDKAYAPALEKLELYDLSFIGSTSASGSVDSVQSLCDALSRRKDSKGLLIVDHCTTLLTIEDREVDADLDMTGRWEDGCFRVVEGSTEPYWDAQSDSEGSEESDEYAYLSW